MYKRQILFIILIIKIIQLNTIRNNLHMLITPRALWDSFWYEGELSCLFADSNVGKSILAVQIADRIARTDNVPVSYTHLLQMEQKCGR